tara:strand:- start:1137 stop:2852 length:1716 start_codon:yes stop_codon:yes gene_type:complete
MAQEEVVLKLTAEIGNLKKELETVKKGVEGIGDSAKATEKNTGKLAKGIKGVGLAFKAAGIALILQGFQLLKDLFMQNQKVADGFGIAFEAVSIAMNDFINFIIGNTGAVVNFFKSVFENPLENIKSLGQAIKDNIIERFNSALEVVGFLADAFKKVFEGDFKGALESAKEAGKEYVDVLTGVDGTVEKVVETTKKVVEATADYVTEITKAATTNVQLAKSAKVAAAALQGVIERFDTATERQRQLRDDETASFEARIAANEILAATLEAQFIQMTKLAELQVASAQAEFDKLENDENLIALMEAKNELAAVEAQITGFRSEQLTNQVSLEKELLEAKNEVFLEGVSEREREIAEVEAFYDDLFKLAKKASLDTTKLEKQKADAIMKIRTAQLMADMDLTAATLGGIASAFGEHTAAYKAIKTVETTISTFTSAQKAFESAAAIPVVGAFLAPIAAAGAVAVGLQNIAKINATQVPEMASGGLVGGMGTGTSDSVNARLSRGESVINARSTRMFTPLLSQINEAGGGRAFDSGLDTSANGMTTGVVKAFVVTDDITNSQDKLTKIRRKATI